MSKKSSGNTVKKAIIIAVVILLPMMSLAIGFFGVQMLMQDAPEGAPKEVEKTTKELLEGDKSGTDAETKEAVSKDPVDTTETEDAAAEETTELDEETMTYTLPSLTTYNIQIGSFGEQANAKKREASCDSDGFGAYVYKSDNYKVFVMSFLDRKKAEVNQAIAAETYEGAYISEISIAPGEITYTEADKAYIHELKQDLETIQSIHRSYTNYVYAYDLTAFDSDDFNAYLITQHNEITKLKEKIMGYTVSEDLKKQHGTVIDYLEQMENQFEYLLNLDNPTREDIWDRYMEIIFEYGSLA